MQEPKYHELEERASLSAELDFIKKLEARSRVRQEIERMKTEGEAFELSQEEQDMLFAFRRFKLRVRKNGEVFRWQTIKPEGVQLAQDTAEVLTPAEATADTWD